MLVAESSARSAKPKNISFLWRTKRIAEHVEMYVIAERMALNRLRQGRGWRGNVFSRFLASYGQTSKTHAYHPRQSLIFESRLKS